MYPKRAAGVAGVSARHISRTVPARHARPQPHSILTSAPPLSLPFLCPGPESRAIFSTSSTTATRVGGGTARAAPRRDCVGWRAEARRRRGQGAVVPAAAPDAPLCLCLGRGTARQSPSASSRPQGHSPRPCRQVGESAQLGQKATHLARRAGSRSISPARVAYMQRSAGCGRWRTSSARLLHCTSWLGWLGSVVADCSRGWLRGTARTGCRRQAARPPGHRGDTAYIPRGGAAVHCQVRRHAAGTRADRRYTGRVLAGPSRSRHPPLPRDPLSPGCCCSPPPGLALLAGGGGGWGSS